MRTSLGATMFLAAALLAGCGGKDGAPAPASAPGPAIMPADAALAKTYGQTCKGCHGLPASGAPQSGDTAAWGPRMAQGMDTLLNHTLSGYKGMPPLGGCADCTPAEFEALIRFMAGEGG